MISNPRLTTLGMLALVCVASSVLAVDLRNTVGDREVIRRVSFAQPLDLEEPDDLEPPSLLGAPSFEEDFLIDDIGQACASCGQAGCALDCLLPARKWAKFEYLLWWRKGMDLPPLAITSSDDTNLNNLRLGLNTTTILFGDETVGDEARPGGRVSLGMWLDDCETCAVEGRFFALGTQTVGFNATSDGATPLGRPFTNTIPDPDDPTSRTLAFPGFNNNGAVNITGTSDVLGGDVLYRLLGCGYQHSRLYLVAGYQYARIEEDLLIRDSTMIISGPTQNITDRFDTRNEFHAGEIGFAFEYLYDCWQFDLLAKIGFGNMKQTVTIAGTTENDGVQVMPPFGLLANVDNQGQFSQNSFSVSPEISATANYALNDCVRLSLGYSFVYWSSVAQAGAHIPARLNVPAPFVFNDNSYWVHGLNAGLEFRF